MQPIKGKFKAIKRATRCCKHPATLSDALTLVAQRLTTDFNKSIGGCLHFRQLNLKKGVCHAP